MAKTSTDWRDDLPTSLQVGPLLIDIVVEDDLGEKASAHGVTSVANQRISIDGSMTGSHPRVVMLHEALHVVWDVLGFSEDDDKALEKFEEPMIKRLAPALLDLFERNPDLTAFLLP